MRNHEYILKENKAAASAFNADSRFVASADPGADFFVVPSRTRTGGWWSIVPILLGLSLVGVCVLVPAIRENDTLRQDLALLEREVNTAKEQARVNTAFVAAVQSDPKLRLRLEALHDQSVVKQSVVKQSVDKKTIDRLSGDKLADSNIDIAPVDDLGPLEPMEIEKLRSSLSALSLPQVKPDSSPIATTNHIPMLLWPLTHSTPRVIVMGIGLLIIAWGLLFGGRSNGKQIVGLTD